MGFPHINRRPKTPKWAQMQEWGRGLETGLGRASHWSSGKWAAERQRLADEVLITESCQPSSSPAALAACPPELCALGTVCEAGRGPAPLG